MENKNLLIVDDEQKVINSIKRDLAVDKYTIFTSVSAKEGLKILKEKNIHVILSDMRMPNMDGASFLFKSVELIPEAIRIAISGYADIPMILDSINKGEVWRFITKPWEDYHLRHVIKQAFEHYELKQEKDRLYKEANKFNKKLSKMNKTLDEKNKQLKTLNETLDKIVSEKTRELQIKNNIMNTLLIYTPFEDTIIKILDEIKKLSFVNDCELIIDIEKKINKFSTGSQDNDSIYKKIIKSGKVVKIENKIAFPLTKNSHNLGCFICTKDAKTFLNNEKKQLESYLPYIIMSINNYLVINHLPEIEKNIDMVMELL